ncbi:MAG: hypothetical protein WC442_00410 [Candidatus Omnitrophota bacterium]
MSNKITIESLFSDSGPFNEEEVVTALLPHLIIQKNSKEIFFKDTKLSAEQKILAYGLAKKLLKSQSLIESEMITAAEVAEKTGIKKGTIDPAFKSLREKRGFLVGRKEYEIANQKIKEILDFLIK